VTVTAPPRPPRPSDPADREELEALVEALIEEARQRARRRRRIYGAVALLVAVVGVALVTVFERTAHSQDASSGLPTAAAANQRAITQTVTSHELFARLKTRPAPFGKRVTASGTFYVGKWTTGPIRSKHCATPPQTCTIGKTLDKGTATSTSTLLVDRPRSGPNFRGTVRGTATATGQGGSATWKFTAPFVSVAPTRFPPHQGPAAGSFPIVVATGKALITHATGTLAQLKGKRGSTAFFFNDVTGVLLISALF